MKTIDFLNEQKFIRHLKKHGAEVLIVGGLVRDHFLNKKSKDIDLLVLNMTQEQIQNELKKFGKIDIFGQRFAVLGFRPNGFDGEMIDIAIPRKDIKKDNPSDLDKNSHHHFDVITDGVTLEEDLFRRDFTINSMAMNLDKNLIDPFNGLSDIQNKIIRMVNPEAFKDDPLRMMRAIQFAARFGFEIEDRTWTEITNNASLIKEIPGERIFDELEKIINKNGDLKHGVDMFFDSKLHQEIFNVKIKPIKMQIKNRIDFFFSITGNLLNPDEKILNILRGDSKTAKIIKGIQTELLTNKHPRVHAFNLFNIHEDATKCSVFDPKLKLAISELQSGKFPKKINELAINGIDLLNIGFKGEQIGKTIKSILHEVLSEKIENNKLVILNHIKNMNKI